MPSGGPKVWGRFFLAAWGCVAARAVGRLGVWMGGNGVVR